MPTNRDIGNFFSFESRKTIANNYQDKDRLNKEKIWQGKLTEIITKHEDTANRKFFESLLNYQSKPTIKFANTKTKNGHIIPLASRAEYDNHQDILLFNPTSMETSGADYFYTIVHELMHRFDLNTKDTKENTLFLENQLSEIYQKTETKKGRDEWVDSRTIRNYSEILECIGIDRLNRYYEMSCHDIVFLSEITANFYSCIVGPCSNKDIMLFYMAYNLHKASFTALHKLKEQSFYSRHTMNDTKQFHQAIQACFSFLQRHFRYMCDTIKFDSKNFELAYQIMSDINENCISQYAPQDIKGEISYYEQLKFLAATAKSSLMKAASALDRIILLSPSLNSQLQKLVEKFPTDSTAVLKQIDNILKESTKIKALPLKTISA